MTDEEQLIDLIQRFINDFTDLLQMIEMTSNENLFIIQINDEQTSFALPATFYSFSRRAVSLQHRLQRFIRMKIQQRREEICKGIEKDFSTEVRQIHWQNDVKSRLHNLSSNPFVVFLRAMINALDLYVEILEENSSTNKTFRIFPIFKNLQQQLCNISLTIRRTMETNRKSIDAHLQQIETKLKLYENEMKEKLRQFIDRDIRPPVLVIPCPTPIPPTELLDQIKSKGVTASIDQEEK